MRPTEAPEVSANTTMDDYRKEYREKQKAFLRAENREAVMEDLAEIAGVIIKPRWVDMKEFRGSDQELQTAIELLYKNDGWAYDPHTIYSPYMIDNYGKDYALNTRGIYYFDRFTPDLVTIDRKVWVPSFQDIDWDAPSECSNRMRARIVMKHNIDNETRHKSEYSWEADAWADIFSGMRNDPCLEVDKHEYLTEMPKTHPVLFSLTGESTVVSRIPDATFGLATFSESIGDSKIHMDELSRERLERLLLHPKCGLLCDPKWGGTDLIFPFAVYEAKGWSGDCREARRQACQAASCYLDMLDNLGRRPGPVGSIKPYQMKTSHQYQVFALTSFGAHWHLLVGYQRPRQAEEHVGTKGLSNNVYIFQRVWSARVVNERAAWELLTLIDQIQLWAITEFRTFVTEHLKPWHKFCEDNYLLDWKSVYDVRPELKQMRTCTEGTEMNLPTWAKLLNETLQQKIQAKARKSLVDARTEHNRRKGKGKCEADNGWHCAQCSNSAETYSSEELLEHLRNLHLYTKDHLAKIKLCVDKVDKEERGQRLVEDTSINANARINNDKRGFAEDEVLNGSSSGSSVECVQGPSKRARVSHDT